MPKGPSLDPADKRMAVHVEDHPIDYAGFEGTIPAGQYGAGKVIVWDRGTWEPVGDARAGYRAGKLKFRLHGEKLSGGWTLVRMHGHGDERQEPWLLIKERDDEARPAAEYSVVEAEPASVLSGRTIEGRPTKAKAAAKATGPSRPIGPPADGRRKPAARPGRRSRRQGGACRPPAGAKKAALPAALSPQLATLVAEPPPTAAGSTRSSSTATGCWHASTATTCACFTRRGNDWSERMPALVDAVRAARPRLGLARRRDRRHRRATARPTSTPCRTPSTRRGPAPSSYYLFDLPYCDGLRPARVPLVERRAVLAARARERPAVRAASASAQNFDASAAELLQNACRMRLEGMIGKRADSAYVSKRSPTWIKLKCTHRQEFVVGGWTDPKGSRTGIGSLLLGIHDETGKLRFAGGVGSGFDQGSLRGAAQGARRPGQRHAAVLREAARRQGPLGPADAGGRGLVRRMDPRRPDPPLGLPRPARRQAGAQHHA